MNERLRFLKKQVQSNIKNLILGWGLLSFIGVPFLLLLVFKIKNDLTTYTILISLIYWIGVFIYYSFQAKKHFQTFNRQNAVETNYSFK